MYHKAFYHSYWGRWMPFFLLLAWLHQPALAQQKEVTFVATTDARQVVEKSYFQISFTLNNANGSNFSAPPFKDFKVLSGANRSTSTTIINGVASYKTSYSYTLQPKREGKFTIAPASIIVNSKTLKSNPVEVNVVKSRDLGGDGEAADNQFFVKAEVDTTSVYIGQQLVVNYKLYTTVNIENYDITYESEYPGFFARDIRRFESRAIREVIDGVQYTTKVLKRIALFPQQTGLLTVDAMSIRLGVVVGRTRPNSFFFNNQIRPANVETNQLKISVKPLPEPQPPNFSGAVGKYAMASYVSRTNISTDDAISVKLDITGTGDVKRLQPPELNFPPSFEVYEPKVLEESSDESRGILRGKKSIEYLVLPKSKGNYEIQPSFSYFDTDSSKYLTLAPNMFRLNVRQGVGQKTTGLVNIQKEKKKDIRYIKTSADLAEPQAPFFQSTLFYLLTAFPFLLFGGTLIYKQILIRNSNVDLVQLKRKKAEKVARKRLKVAEKHLKENNSKAFYDEISRASFGYVCDKLNIPLSELTKENVKGKLEQLEVSPEPIKSFMEIIKTAEMALFAGMDNSPAMNQTYQKSIEVISLIEAELIDK